MDGGRLGWCEEQAECKNGMGMGRSRDQTRRDKSGISFVPGKEDSFMIKEVMGNVIDRAYCSRFMKDPERSKECTFFCCFLL